MYACFQYIFKKPQPVIKVTKYGSILDKDPELRKDLMKYDPKTIGVTDESIISEVQPDENSYFDESTFDRKKALTNLIPDNLKLRDNSNIEGNSLKFDASWDKRKVPDFM